MRKSIVERLRVTADAIVADAAERACSLRAAADEIERGRCDERSDEPTKIYSTAPGGLLPPGKTRRWLRDHAPEIPGAVRRGGRRGRSVRWDVPADAFEAWLAGRASAPLTPTTADVVEIDQWIAASGHRFTKKRAR
jgi:hypothetical protein